MTDTDKEKLETGNTEEETSTENSGSENSLEGANKEVETKETERNANAEESENKNDKTTKEVERDTNAEDGATTSATDNDSIPNVDSMETNNKEDVYASGWKLKNPLNSAKKPEATNTKAVTKDVKKKDTDNKAMNNQAVPRNTTDGVTVTDRTNLNSQETFYNCSVKYSLRGPHGKGLCVVFALFTGKTKGYEVDVTNMEKFFHDELGYTFMTYRNLTSKQLLDTVEEVKKIIQNEKDHKYDRLFVVILSHGTKDGILTCANEDGHAEEVKDDSNESEVLTTEVSEIVDHFKHDKLTSLKGVPKVFLVQTCRGPPTNVVVAGSNFCQPDDGDDDTLPYNPACPVDGDIMICYATTFNHPSFVSNSKGSWFIQDLLGVFRKYYKKHHVVDMMTAVNLANSERRHKLKNITALQMPCLWSSFRKQCYLYSDQ